MTESKALMNFTPMNLDDLDAQEKQIGFGSGSSTFYQFKDGRNVIRFLPGLFGRQPFIQFWKHFVKGTGDGKMYSGPCPAKMAKLPCVIDQIAAKLSRGSDADRSVAEELGARGRVVANIIDRAAPDAGPQVAEFGTSIYNAVKDYMRTMGDDPTHPTEGFDMIIEKSGSGLKTEYKVVASRKTTPLHTDPRQMADWLQSATDLGTYVILPQEHEQAARLSGTIIGHLLGKRAEPQPRQTRTTQTASTKDAMTYDPDDETNY